MQCGVQAGFYIRRQINGCGARVNLNGLAGLIDDHGAVFAVLQVAFQFLLQSGIEVAVYIVRQFADDMFAIQFGPPSRKYRFRR